MAHERVRLKTSDDAPIRWHYVLSIDDPRTLCTGWVWWDGQPEFGGAAPPVEQPFKGFEKITCEKCREMIKEFKSI